VYGAPPATSSAPLPYFDADDVTARRLDDGMYARPIELDSDEAPPVGYEEIADGVGRASPTYANSNDSDIANNSPTYVATGNPRAPPSASGGALSLVAATDIDPTGTLGRAPTTAKLGTGPNGWVSQWAQSDITREQAEALVRSTGFDIGAGTFILRPSSQGDGKIVLAVLYSDGSISSYQISVGAEGGCNIHNIAAAKLIYLPEFTSLDSLVGFFGDPANNHVLGCTLTVCVPPTPSRAAVRGAGIAPLRTVAGGGNGGGAPGANTLRGRKNRETIYDFVDDFKTLAAEGVITRGVSRRPPREIPRNKVRLGRTLGSGHYGEVLEAEITDGASACRSWCGDLPCVGCRVPYKRAGWA
jgi:hypothetical protein